jgi:hypothetical protein
MVFAEFVLLLEVRSDHPGMPNPAHKADPYLLDGTMDETLISDGSSSIVREVSSNINHDPAAAASCTRAW